ncbi:hypothetical protein CPR19088_GLDEOEPO_00846 [Companilactobacillus paralimentarius]
MNNYEDVRIQKTRLKIFSALTALLKMKSFTDITISDICHEANISRATFYHHYQTKEDIVQAYQLSTMQQVYRLAEHSNLDILTFFERLTYYLDQNAILLGELLSERGTLSLQTQIKKQMTKFFQEKMLPQLQIYQTEDSLTLEYTAYFYANAIFGVIQHWLTSSTRQSPEQMTKILRSIITNKLLS